MITTRMMMIRTTNPKITMMMIKIKMMTTREATVNKTTITMTKEAIVIKMRITTTKEATATKTTMTKIVKVTQETETN